MGACVSKSNEAANQPPSSSAQHQQKQQQQQHQPSSPSPSAPPQEELHHNNTTAVDPKEVQLGVMGNGGSHDREGHQQQQQGGTGGEGQASSSYRRSSDDFSTASAPEGNPNAQPGASFPPGGAAVLPLMSGAAPGGAFVAGTSFSAWNADGASAERNRSLALLLRTMHEALLDEPATSESLRTRAQQALRQSEKEVAELHALPRLHGLHFNQASSGEAAIISTLDSKSPATTAPPGAGGVVSKDHPNTKPDLARGDRVLAIEGISVLNAAHANMLLQSQLCLPGQSVDLTIQRGSNPPFRTRLHMASSSASAFDLEQRHSRLETNLDFVRSLRAEVEQQKDVEARMAQDRAREEAAVARAAELARQRALEKEEAERQAEAQAAMLEAAQSSAYRARKLAERAERVAESSAEVAFRTMMLVLAKSASASSSSLASAGAASALAPQGTKEILKNLLQTCLQASGTVEAALFGEDGLGLVAAAAQPGGPAVPAGVSPSSGALLQPISSIPLPNAKLHLAELQQHVVTRLLSAGPLFLVQPLSVQRGAVEQVLSEWRLVQQSKAVEEAEKAEAIRLAALRANEARQSELDKLQRQIAAAKHAAVVAAADARRISSQEREQVAQQHAIEHAERHNQQQYMQQQQQQPLAFAAANPGSGDAPVAGWEGMPPWSAK